MPSILQRTNMSSLGTDYMGKARYVIVDFMDKLLMRPALFKHLQDRGIQVYVWVLNTEEEFDKAFKCGVTGVMTDYPTKLKNYLEKNPQYSR